MKPIRSSWLWLAAGAVLMLFANGRWIIPATAWIYPVFFIRFMHAQNTFRGFIFLMPVMALVNMISWWHMIPAPPAVYFMMTGVFFQVYALPFLLERLYAHRINGFLSTLLFPLACCSIEYLTSFIPTKASWCSAAYTQYLDLPLMQLLSVTGIWGVSFLMSWFAAIVAWAWNQHFEWIIIRKGLIVFTSVAASVWLFGALRLNVFPPEAQSIRTASIVTARDIHADLSSCKWEDAKGIGRYSIEVENNLLERTQQAAHSGAKIVLWQESAGFIPKQEEAAFIKRGTRLAQEEKIYLLMTLWSVPEDFPDHLVENKLVAIDPAGSIRFIYIKNNPAAPEHILRGNGHLPILETPFGKIATAICFDGDFQRFIRQAGKGRADILFLPANDWKAIDPIHSYMAIARAIENGCSLVHPVGQGLSLAADNRGRVLSAMDFYSTTEQIMYADVPVLHSDTVYAHVGDFFPWLCLAGLLVFIGRPDLLLRNPVYLGK